MAAVLKYIDLCPAVLGVVWPLCDAPQPAGSER